MDSVAPPLPSSAPSPNSRRSSSGFFHSVKRAVLGPSTTSSDDSDFNASKADFIQLHGFLSNLRLHLTAYNKSIQSVYTASLQCANDYADIIKVPSHILTHTTYIYPLISSTHLLTLTFPCCLVCVFYFVRIYLVLTPTPASSSPSVKLTVVYKIKVVSIQQKYSP
jgi:hypothetical protein